MVLMKNNQILILHKINIGHYYYNIYINFLDNY